MKCIIIATFFALALATCVYADGGNSGSGDCRVQCNIPTNQLPICATGQLPSRNRTTCCLTCRPAVVVPCSSSRIEDCTRQARACNQGEMPTFNATACCLSCRQREPSNSDDRPGNDGRCSRNGFRNCIDNAPVCAAGERPLHNASFCCPSCLPPQDKCNKTSAAECIASRPVCGASEDPLAVEGECCNSCRIPVPTCTPACDSTTQVCIRLRNESLPWYNRAAVCRSKVGLRMRLGLRAAVTAAVRDAFQQLTCQGLADLIQTVAYSYCAQNANTDNCNRFANALSNMILGNSGCSGVGSTQPTVNVDIGGGADDSGVAPSSIDDESTSALLKKFIAQANGPNDFDTFMNSAFGDTVSNSDFAIQIESSESSAGANTASVASFITLFSIVVTTLLVLW